MNREISFPSFPLFAHLPENRHALSNESKILMDKALKMGLQVGSVSCLAALPTTQIMGMEEKEQEVEEFDLLRGNGVNPSWSRAEVMEGERDYHDDLSPNMFLKRQLFTFWNLMSENNTAIVESGVCSRVILYSELLGECFLRLKDRGMTGQFLISGSGIGSLSGRDDFFLSHFGEFADAILNPLTKVQEGVHFMDDHVVDTPILDSYFTKIRVFFEKFKLLIVKLLAGEDDIEIEVENCKQKFLEIKHETEIEGAFSFESLLRECVARFRSHFPNLPLPWILDPNMMLSNRKVLPYQAGYGIDPSFLPLAFETVDHQVSHPFLSDEHDFSIRLSAKKRRKLGYCLKGEESMDADIDITITEAEQQVERDKDDAEVAPFERSIHCNFQFLIQFCSDFQMKIIDFAMRESSRMLESALLAEKRSSLFKEFSLIPVAEYLLFQKQLEDLKLRSDSLYFSLYSQHLYFLSFRYTHLFSSIRLYRLFNWMEFWGLNKSEAYLLDDLNGLMSWNTAEKFFSFYQNNENGSLGSLGNWIRSKIGIDNTDSFGTIETISSFVQSGKAFVFEYEVDPKKKHKNEVEVLIEFELERIRRGDRTQNVSLLFPSDMVVSIFSQGRNAVSKWKITKLVPEELENLRREPDWKDRVLIDYRQEKKLLEMVFGKQEIQPRRVFNEGLMSFSIENSVGGISYRAFPSIAGFEAYSELMRNCVSEISLSSNSIEAFLTENKFGPGQGKWKFALFDEEFPINTRVRLMISLSFLSMVCILRGLNKSIIQSRLFGTGLIGGVDRNLGNPSLQTGKFRNLMYLQMQRRDGENDIAYSLSFPSTADLSRNLAFYSISLRSIASEFDDFSSFIAETGGSYQVFGYTNQSSKVFPICFGVGVLSFQFFPNPRSGVVPMAGSLPFPARSEFIDELKAMGLDEKQGVFDVASWTKQVLNAADPELIPYLPEGRTRESVIEDFVKVGKSTLERALDKIDSCPFNFPPPKEMLERSASIFGGSCWFNSVILGLKDIFEHQVFPFDGAKLDRFSNFIIPEKRDELHAQGKLDLDASAFKFDDFYQALTVEWILSFRMKQLFSKSLAVDAEGSKVYPYASTPLFKLLQSMLISHVNAKKKVTSEKQDEVTLIGGRMNIEDQRSALDWLCLIIAGMFGYGLQIRLREVKYKEDKDYSAEFIENGKPNLKKFSNSFSVVVSSGIKRKQALKKEELKYEFPNLTSFRAAAKMLVMNGDERIFCANVPIVEVKLMYLYQHVFNISLLQGTEQIFNFCLNLKKYFLFPDDHDEIGCYDLGYTNSVKDQLKWINDNFALFCDRFITQKYSSYFLSLSPVDRDRFQKSVLKVLERVKLQYDHLVDFSKGEDPDVHSMAEIVEDMTIESRNETFSKIQVGVKGASIPFICDKVMAAPIDMDQQNALLKKEAEMESTFALIFDFETYISKSETDGGEEEEKQVEEQQQEEEALEESIPSILEDDFGLDNENVEEQTNGSLDDVLAFSTKKTAVGKVNIGRVIPFAFGLCSNRPTKEDNRIYLWMKEVGTIDISMRGKDKEMFYFDKERVKNSEILMKEQLIPWGQAFWIATFREVLQKSFLPMIRSKLRKQWEKYQDYLTSAYGELDPELHIHSWKEHLVMLSQPNVLKCDSEYSFIEIDKSEENPFGVIAPIPVYAHNGARFDFFFLLKSAGFFDFIRILKHSGFIQIIAQADIDLFIPEIQDRNGYTIFEDKREMKFEESPSKMMEGQLKFVFAQEMKKFSSFLTGDLHCSEEDISDWVDLSFFPVEWKVKSLGQDMKRKNAYSQILKDYAFSVARGNSKRKGERKVQFKELLPAKRGFDGLFLSAWKSIILSFQDSYRIAPLPLRTLCSSYHCSVQKGIFPYSFLTEERYNELSVNFLPFLSLLVKRVKAESQMSIEEEDEGERKTQDGNEYITRLDEELRVFQNQQIVTVQASEFSNGKKDLDEFRQEFMKIQERGWGIGNDDKSSVLCTLTSFDEDTVTYPVLLALVEYLIGDVFGLEEVVSKHCSALIHAFHCDPYQTLTLPSYAFKFLGSTNVLSDACFASSIPIDLFIRRGIKGGATMLTSHKFSLKENYLSWARKTGAVYSFPPNEEEEIKQLSLKSSDPLFDFYYPIEGEVLDLKKLMKFYKTCSTFGAISNLDVNSLYPSAMTMFPLPSGDAYWLGGERENLQVMDAFKMKWKNLDFSCPLMVMCDFEYGKKSSMLPLIGEKRSPGKTVFASVPRMMYDFAPKSACVLSTPEIEILYRFYEGKITKIYGVIMFSEWTYSIGALIYEIYQKRLEFKKQKNPIELAYKLIMNSLYGKWIQQYPDKQLSIFDLKMNMSNLMCGFEKQVHSAASIATHLFESDRNINSNWREFSYLCVSLFDTVRSMVFLPNGQCVVEQKMLKFNGCYSLNDSKIIPNGTKSVETAVSIPSVWGVYVLGNSKLIDARYLAMLNQGDQIRFYDTAGSIQLGNGCYYMDTDSFHIDVRCISSKLVDGQGMMEVDDDGNEYYGKDMRNPNVQNCFKIGKELGNISSDIEIDARTVEFFKANYEEEYLKLCEEKKSEMNSQESLIQFLLFNFYSGVPCYITEGRYVATKTYCEQVLTLCPGDESKGQDKRYMYWGTKTHLRAKGINIKDIYSLIGSTASKDILSFYSSLIESDIDIESHQMSFAAGTKLDAKFTLNGYNVSKSQKSGRKWVSRPTIPAQFEGNVRENLQVFLQSHDDLADYEKEEWIRSILHIWSYFEESANTFTFDVAQIFEFLLNIRPPFGWHPVPGSLMNYQIAQLCSNKTFLDKVQKKKVTTSLFEESGESKHVAAAAMMTALNKVLDTIPSEEESSDRDKAFVQANELCQFLSSQGKFNTHDKDCPFVVDPNIDNNW